LLKWTYLRVFARVQLVSRETRLEGDYAYGV
jgi:hypothetical protein